MICLVLSSPLTRWIKIFEKSHTWGSQVHHTFHGLMGPISSAFDILTFILLYFIIVPMTTGHAYVHGADSAVGFYCLVSDRLVYRVYVVTNYGYPYVAFSQNSFYKVVQLGWSLMTTLLAAAFSDLPSYGPLASLLHLTPLKSIYFIFLLFHHYFVYD